MRNTSFCPSVEIHSFISNLGKAYQEKGNKDGGKDCFTNVSILQPEFLSKTTSIINKLTPEMVRRDATYPGLNLQKFSRIPRTSRKS
jgi:hypothetical protein